MSIPKFVAVIVTIFAVLIAVAAISRTFMDSPVHSNGKKTPSAATTDTSNHIWKKGTSWAVSRTVNSGGVMLHDQGSAYTQSYSFAVTAAPKHKGGKWTVRAYLTGAQGPLADGFSLYYKERADGSMKLVDGALGSGSDAINVGLDQITMLVGPDFPLEKTYSKTPKDAFAGSVSHRPANAPA